jgi:hypothetical protein
MLCVDGCIWVVELENAGRIERIGRRSIMRIERNAYCAFLGECVLGIGGLCFVAMSAM